MGSCLNKILYISVLKSVFDIGNHWLLKMFLPLPSITLPSIQLIMLAAVGRSPLLPILLYLVLNYFSFPGFSPS